MENIIEFKIDISPDENGYLDRECKFCNNVFKVYSEDWINKIGNNKYAYCPYCGKKNETTNFNTTKQMEEVKKQGIALTKDYAINEIHKMFLEAFSNSKFITYKPGKITRFQKYPIQAIEPFVQECKCQECSTRFSGYGNMFFCPCCSKKQSEKIFVDKLAIVRMKIENINTITFEGATEEQLLSLRDDIREDLLHDLVSYFQVFAFDIYNKLKTPNDKSVPSTLFQRTRDGSDAFKAITSYGYKDIISQKEMEFMYLEFEKRHCYEHRGGIIDEEYIKKTKDTNYQIGNKLQIHSDEISTLCGILEKLSKGLLLLKHK